MAITSYSATRTGNCTTVTVTSDLSGAIYFHWYIDGAFVATTRSPSRSFFLELGEQVRIEALDTTDPDYDPIANAPAGYPARRSIWWVRSTDSDVKRYRVEMQKNGGAWSTVAIVNHRPGVWMYRALTGRLDDLSSYVFRVIPIDAAGNDGTAVTLETEKIVRTPDAPAFTISFDEPTAKVTFSAA